MNNVTDELRKDLCEMFNINSYECDQQIKNPKIGNCRRIEVIPPEWLNESALVVWLFRGGSLQKIPAEFRTERVLFTAVRHDFDAYAQIRQDEVSNHRELSLEAMRRGKAQLYMLPESYLNEDFIIEATDIDTTALQGFCFQKRLHLFTDRVAEAICSRSLTHVRGFLIAGSNLAAPMVKDEYIKAAILNECSDYSYLRELKKEYLLVELLKDGFWPQGKSTSEERQWLPPTTPPADFAEALDVISSTNSLGSTILFQSWLKTHKTHDVVHALHSSKEGIDQLFEIYSDRELRTYMNDYRSLRGRLIENDLGM